MALSQDTRCTVPGEPMKPLKMKLPLVGPNPKMVSTDQRPAVLSTLGSSAVASETLLHSYCLGQCSRKKAHFSSKFWK